MEEYGAHISDKFSGLIIKNLKELTDNGKNTDHLKLVSELFELISENGK
jgi:glutamyl-tRNA reductase